MEILSDATFKGNVSINDGNFSVKVKGISGSEMVASDISLLTTNISGSSVSVYGGFYVNPLNDNQESGLTITKGKDAAAYLKFKGTEFFEGQTHFDSGFRVSAGQSVHLPNYIYVENNHIKFPSEAGTLALASQIPSKTYRANRTIPANCTAFEFVDCYTNSNDDAWVCVSHNYEKMLTQVVDGGYCGGNVIQMDIKHVYDYDNNRV